MTERREQQPNQRLAFAERKGWYQFGRIPYRVRYNFDYPDSETGKDGVFDLNEKHPGAYLLTPDLDFRWRTTGHSVSVFIHESVPKQFEDVVMYHELREAELFFADGVPRPEAHNQSEKETSEYAQRYLTSEEFERFKEWQSGLNVKKNEL